MSATKLTDLDYLGPTTKARLIDNGYRTTDDIRRTSAEELLSVPGVGVTILGRLIDPEEPEVTA